MQEAHILAMLLLGVCTFAVGSIPLKLARNTAQPLALSLTLCFGGGVLLSTAITHMLTESTETLNWLAGILFCSGFLLLYAVDEVIHVCIGDIHEIKVNHEDPSRRSSASSREGSPPSNLQTAMTNYGTLQKLPKRARIDSVSKSFHEDEPLDELTTSHYNALVEAEHCCRKHDKEHSFRRAAWKNHHCEERHLKEEDIESESSEWQSDGSSHEFCHVEVKQKPCNKSSMSLPGMLTALLVHSILEGISIGVQTDSYQILLVLAAVACHKLILAFCLGLELANAEFEGLRFVIIIAAFSIGCPIGIGAGVTLINGISSFSTVEGSLQAVAGGSLLYVAVFEVLPRERFKWQHRPDYRLAGFFQMLFVVFGFSVMTLTDTFVGGFHGHNHTLTHPG